MKVTNLLSGAREIAAYVYGDPEKEMKVRDLWRRSRYPHRFPMFKLGGTLCARRTAIDDWFTSREHDDEPYEDGEAA